MRAAAVLGLVLALASRDASAQEAAPPKRFEGRVDLGATYFDNFLQSPSGVPESDIWAEFTRCELAWRAGEQQRLRVSIEPEFVNYERFGGSPGIRARIARSGKMHSFAFGASHVWDRPHVDADDNPTPSDTFGLDGEYSLRTGQAQLTFRGQFRDDDAQAPEPDATLTNGGMFVRWRPKKGQVSPEFGAMYGHRDPDVETQAYVQRDLTVKIIATPTKWSYLSFGYRRRHRDYDTKVATARYFGRDDDREQLSLSAHFDSSPRDAWNLYWSLEEAESDQRGHDYIAHVISAWWSRKF